MKHPENIKYVAISILIYIIAYTILWLCIKKFGKDTDVDI